MSKMKDFLSGHVTPVVRGEIVPASRHIGKPTIIAGVGGNYLYGNRGNQQMPSVNLHAHRHEHNSSVQLHRHEHNSSVQLTTVTQIFHTNYNFPAIPPLNIPDLNRLTDTMLEIAKRQTPVVHSVDVRGKRGVQERNGAGLVNAFNNTLDTIRAAFVTDRVVRAATDIADIQAGIVENTHRDNIRLVAAKSNVPFDEGKGRRAKQEERHDFRTAASVALGRGAYRRDVVREDVISSDAQGQDGAIGFVLSTSSSRRNRG